MAEQRSSRDRISLLVNVAEMYYLQNKTQEEIARQVGVTRSMISRILSEARAKGIVEIRIHRPMQYERTLETTLIQHFRLKDARVVDLGVQGEESLLTSLGAGGAELLIEYLDEETILGTTWGTSISAVVDQIEVRQPLPIKIVQLVGALGARLNAYNGNALVQRLAQKLGGEAYLINAPFICPNAEMARSLLDMPGVQEAVQIGQKANLALLGVGSTSPEYSSFFLAGYVSLPELEDLRAAGAIGDVCGLHFDKDGNDACGSFSRRLVTIEKGKLLRIPVRIGVAGGAGKIEPILGALKGGFINALVTDNFTAKKLLECEGILF